MRTRSIAMGMIAFCGLNAIAGKKDNMTSLRGHIVAFRPTERLGQVVSGVINQETFLFSVEGTFEDTVKVLYEHDGYSEISGPAAEKNTTLFLKVRRDHSCDGSYAKFVSESPILTSEDKSTSVPAVTMLGNFKGLPPSYKLKCYRLQRGDVSTKK